VEGGRAECPALTKQPSLDHSAPIARYSATSADTANRGGRGATRSGFSVKLAPGPTRTGNDPGMAKPGVVPCGRTGGRSQHRRPAGLRVRSRRRCAAGAGPSVHRLPEDQPVRLFDEGAGDGELLVGRVDRGSGASLCRQRLDPCSLGLQPTVHARYIPRPEDGYTPRGVWSRRSRIPSTPVCRTGRVRRVFKRPMAHRRHGWLRRRRRVVEPGRSGPRFAAISAPSRLATKSHA